MGAGPLTIAGVERSGGVARPDGELVAAVRAGDVGAFDELYREHVGAVRTVARSHVRDADTVADIVQDTFARALQHLDALRDGDRFRPWLLSIARNAAVDQLRSRTKVTALDTEQADAIVSLDASPDDVAELHELANQVQVCVTGLSSRDATAVTMVTQLGFSPAQVATALGVTTGAAKVIVHRARRRLRSALMLELLVQQPGLGCDEFRALRAGDPGAATLHLNDCPDCIESAGAELVSSHRRGGS